MTSVGSSVMGAAPVSEAGSADVAGAPSPRGGVGWDGGCFFGGGGGALRGGAEEGRSSDRGVADDSDWHVSGRLTGGGELMGGGTVALASGSGALGSGALASGSGALGSGALASGALGSGSCALASACCVVAGGAGGEEAGWPGAVNCPRSNSRAVASAAKTESGGAASFFSQRRTVDPVRPTFSPSSAGDRPSSARR